MDIHIVNAVLDILRIAGLFDSSGQHIVQIIVDISNRIACLSGSRIHLLGRCIQGHGIVADLANHRR